MCKFDGGLGNNRWNLAKFLPQVPNQASRDETEKKKVDSVEMRPPEV